MIIEIDSNFTLPNFTLSEHVYIILLYSILIERFRLKQKKMVWKFKKHAIFKPTCIIQHFFRGGAIFPFKHRFKKLSDFSDDDNFSEDVKRESNSEAEHDWPSKADAVAEPSEARDARLREGGGAETSGDALERKQLELRNSRRQQQSTSSFYIAKNLKEGESGLWQKFFFVTGQKRAVLGGHFQSSNIIRYYRFC